MVSLNGDTVAETRLGLGGDSLTIGFDARRFSKRVKLLRREFFIFISILTLLGAFFSWLLYRYQAVEKRRTRDFERMLARQHEEASLGRATATIAHEVRNPLNAISIGLQRLEMESGDMASEHRGLIHSMATAVQRTNKIITDLQRFTRPIQPKEGYVDLGRVIESVLLLYEQQYKDFDIKISVTHCPSMDVAGDSELLSEVFENLVKNALEAQPEGGFLDIQFYSDNNRIKIILKNGGAVIAKNDVRKLTEPYFTTKTKGCGLGLSISKRIVEAHNGTMTIDVDINKKEYSAIVELPTASG